ncbi:MAG TPA: restriction endonuclease subunit S, partial [Vicingus sp.]|nr:restriction endonuclease subunit S [Vicingus sp.]
TKKRDRLAENEMISNAKTLVGYKIVEKGDLVINIMLAWNGSLGISKFNGITSPAYCVYRSLIGGEKYFGYLFRTKEAQQEFKKQSTGIIDSRLRLYTDKFFNIKTVIPTPEEQTAIARFLDYKLAKINRFIQKKKQLIKLLNEQKAAIINQAVTKGLEANAKMKDAGIEWLGDIPEHWEVWRLKYLINGKLKYGANESGGDFVENHPRYIRITDFDKSGKLRDNTFCSLNPELAEPYLLKEGDILFARSGGTVGKTFQFKNYDGVACYAGYLIKAEPNTTKITSDYLFAFTNSGIYDQWKSFIFNKATIENIGADKYSLLPVILPPLTEQQQIVYYIEKETAIINTTISKIEKELALTEEYKTALIAEAVTGKIDVRNYEIPTITEPETYNELEEELYIAAEDETEYQNEDVEE